MAQWIHALYAYQKWKNVKIVIKEDSSALENEMNNKLAALPQPHESDEHRSNLQMGKDEDIEVR